MLVKIDFCNRGRMAEHFPLSSVPSPGARGEAEAPNADQEALGGQPAAAGGVADLGGQAQEVHRVGLQHHRHELTLYLLAHVHSIFLIIITIILVFCFFFSLPRSDINTDKPLGIEEALKGVNT